jgi:co-chaperonin GroES (HSP10)
MKLMPGKIMVNPIKEEEKTKGGIIISTPPDRCRRYLKGEVIAVGEYKYLYYKEKENRIKIGKTDMNVKIGDKIIFEEARARDFTDKELTNGKKYYLLEDEDLIYAKFN